RLSGPAATPAECRPPSAVREDALTSAVPSVAGQKGMSPGAAGANGSPSPRAPRGSAEGPAPGGRGAAAGGAGRAPPSGPAARRPVGHDGGRPAPQAAAAQAAARQRVARQAGPRPRQQRGEVLGPAAVAGPRGTLGLLVQL